jgi:hypothetical protein
MPVEILGQSLTLTGVAEVKPVKGRIQVRFEELTAEGVTVPDLARGLINGYADRISVNVALPKLPYGLVVRDVQPTPEGLAVVATAQDVPFNG